MQSFDLKQYRESLKTKYNIADEDFEPFAKGQITSTSEFGKYQAEHKRAMETVQAKYDELMVYEKSIQELEATYGPREQWSAAFQQRVAAHNPDGSNAMPNAVTQADLQRVLNAALQKQRDELTTTFQSQLEEVGKGAALFSEFYYEANEHWKSTYGTSLPKEEFRKFYQENGHTNPQVAMSLFEQPYRDKKREEEWTKKLDEARNEGRMSALSQAGIPEVSHGGGWMAEGAPSVGAVPNLQIGKAPDDQSNAAAVADFSSAMAKIRQAQSASSAAPAVGTK